MTMPFADQPPAKPDNQTNKGLNHRRLWVILSPYFTRGLLMRFKFSAAMFAVFCLSTAILGQGVPLSNDAGKGYLIGPGDEITGKVLGEKDFDFVATVDEDGKIEVPFFDKPVVAKCRSERELRTDITGLLAKYLRTPQASVRVTQRNSRPPISVYGEVRQQQQFVLTRTTYLLEVISAAGGVTEKSGGTIQVFRTRPPICGDPGLANDWKTETATGLDVPSRIYSL